MRRVRSYIAREYRAACLRRKDIDLLYDLAKKAFTPFQLGECMVKRMKRTARCTGYAVHYDGKTTLPVYILPLVHPLPSSVVLPLKILHNEMHDEGFNSTSCQMSTCYEHREAHLWVAMLAKGRFLPVGRVIFSLVERTVISMEPELEAPDTLRLTHDRPQHTTRTWLLRHVWLKPDYRRKGIFSNTIPYLEVWHPDFTVSDPGIPMRQAFKKHPRHLVECDVKWF